jgi:tetratricopeptide (TPR) repeat protein
MAVFEEILKSNPDHVEAGIELAELLSPAKEPDRVIAVLEPLLKYKHDYPLYHLLAEAHYQKEQFDEARKNYEEAVKFNPRSSHDHYQLGNIYLAQKRFAKAAESYETAGSLGLSSGAYHFKLASVYFNLRNFVGHVGTAEVIGGKPGEIKNDLYLIDPVPGQTDAFYVAGPRSALYQVVKAQQLGVDVFDIRFLEANTWLSARRFANAERIYAGLEEKVTKDEAGLYWFYRAQAALGLEDYDGYLARLEKAIAAEPDVYKPTLADALVTVANRYQQRGESDRYVEYLTKAVGANPLSAQLHLALGDAYWLASQREPAVQQYRLVLELEPDHGQRVRLLNRIRGQE